MLIKQENRRFELVSSINCLHLGYRTGQGSLQVYGGEAHAGKCEGVSMPNLATERHCECRKLLAPQIFSQIYPITPNTAVL